MSESKKRLIDFRSPERQPKSLENIPSIDWELCFIFQTRYWCDAVMDRLWIWQTSYHLPIHDMNLEEIKRTGLRFSFVLLAVIRHISLRTSRRKLHGRCGRYSLKSAKHSPVSATNQQYLQLKKHCQRWKDLLYFCTIELQTEHMSMNPEGSCCAMDAPATIYHILEQLLFIM